MSLRTSAHTGVAIRFPAEMPGKTVVHRANSQLLRICREELLFVMCCRKEYGLPRRFAPRNDMQRLAVCSRRKNVLQGQLRTRLRIHPAARPCTRSHAATFCMSSQNTALQPHTRLCLLHVIANQCAHWCGNPFPRRETWQAGNL